MRIEKRETKNGKVAWRAVIDYKDDKGHPHRHTKTFSTRKAAKEYGARKTVEFAEGKKPPAKAKRTLNDVFEEWELVESINLAHNTRCSYQYHYDRFIRDSLGGLSIEEIDYKRLQIFFNEQRSYCSSTTNLIRATLKKVMDYGIKMDYISSHPLSLVTVKGAKPKKERQQYLEEDDFKKLVDYFKNDKQALAYLYLGYYAGLRRSETLALYVSDIDLNQDVLYISRQLEFKGRKKSEFTTTETKTDSSAAAVPICSPLHDFLSDMVKNHPHKLLVCDSKGDFTVPATICTRLSKGAKALEIDFHYHMLRHTFITNLIRNGADPKLASRLARHANVNTTLDVYTEISRQDMETALENAFPSSNHEKD